jgi:hypothetical protein
MSFVPPIIATEWLAPLAVSGIVQIDDRVAVLLLASGSLLACLAVL